MIHKVSLIQLLRRAYLERLASRRSKGSRKMTHANWFGAYYQEPSQLPPELRCRAGALAPHPPGVRRCRRQKKAWFANRTGALVGIDTAPRFGWKLGDRSR